MITANVIHRVFCLITQKGIGTGFTIEIDNKQYLITAKHLVEHIAFSKEKKGVIRIFHKNQQKMLHITLVGHCNEENDISVLSTDIQISPTYNMKPSVAQLAYGQDVYFLGFPYLDGKDISNINRNFPMPFVKKAIVSNMSDIRRKKVIFYLDGHNNPGFSGGPVIFKPIGHTEYQVAAVISGYRCQQDSVYQGDEQSKLATKFKYETNTGIIISYGIKCAVDLIKKHPIGFKINNE